MIHLTIAMRAVAAAALMLSMLVAADRAYAQEGEPATVATTAEPRSAKTTTTRVSIRESVDAIDYTTIPASDTSNWQPPAALQKTPGLNQRSTTRKVLGGLLGAAAGFFGGGYLGATIDGDCGGCDDPGFRGAVTGAPIGAAVGAIIGARWF